MQNDDSSRFGDALVYEDNVPIVWRETGGDLSAAQILRTQQSNERVLRCLAALEEYRAESADEEHGHVAHELSRIESKLNLLLDMAARLLVEHVALPAAVPVTMSAAGLRWRAASAPATGSLLSIDIYLNRGYPSPITLHGEVTRVSPAEGNYQIEVRYRDMGEPLRSWLEKMIFRYHRRQIAHARQQGRT